VRGANSVHEQARSRKSLDQRARSSGVIEVDVGDYETGNLVGIKTGGTDASKQRLYGRRRAGFD
jgi:hypothetical protein